MPKASKGAYYAVRVGRVPGVYTTWDEAKAQVNGQAGAKHQKFATYEEAHAFVFPGQAGTASASASTSSITVASTSGKTVSTKSKAAKTSVDVSEDGYVVVYTDGACKDNQGSGPNKRAGLGVWWGAGDSRNIAERCPGDQTNNRAELIALIRALETIPHQNHKIMLKTDSKYSIQCMEEWIHGWIRNGWKKSDGKPVLNAPLIRYLSALLDERAYSRQTVRLVHVAGHAGIAGNEGADQLANQGCWMPAVTEEPDWDDLALEVGIRREDTAELVRSGAGGTAAAGEVSLVREARVSV